jgi:hypothetical protein
MFLHLQFSKSVDMEVDNTTNYGYHASKLVIPQV